MEFNFQTTIKETKGALNTAAKIAAVLEKSEVIFSTLSRNGVPGIWVKFPDAEKPTFVAKLDDNADENSMYYEEYSNDLKWWTSYAKNPFKTWRYESYLFEHLTDAAEEMVNEWIQALCDEYERRLSADKRPAEQI